MHNVSSRRDSNRHNYHPIVEPYLIDGKHVLVLRAPGGQSRPYKAADSLSKDNRSYSYYLRKGSSTVQARHDDEIELMSLAAQIPFDDRMNRQATLRDLDQTLIHAFLREVGSDLADASARMPEEELFRRMGLVDGPPEALLPRNIGLMFFSEHPDRFFPQTQIDVVQFPDGPGGSRLIEKTFKGPVTRMLRAALAYLDTSIIESFVVKHSDRAEADRFFNYPYLYFPVTDASLRRL